MTTTTLVQVEFRARDDDVTLNSPTFTYVLNANFSQNVDTNFRVRFTIAETGGGHANNIAFSLQYNLAGAGFVAIGDTAAVKSAISAQFVNAEPTVQVISSGSFVAGAGYEQTTTSNISLISNRTEIEWCLSLDSAQVTNGQTLTLRVVQDTGTVLQTYTQTPTITVVEAAAFAASQTAYQFAEDGTESGATLIGTLNTTLVRDVTADSNLQLRVRLQETGGVAGAATDDYQLQCSLEGGAFANVTAASTGVKINTIGALVGGAATTNRLGAGSGSFVAGEQEELDGNVEDHQLTASNFTEHVWALTLVAADLNEVAFITFRVLRNGAVITYSVTPTITVEMAGTAEPTTGSATLTGQAPTWSATVDITAEPTTASLAATGFAPTVAASSALEPTTATLTATGLEPTFTAETNFAAEPATATITATGLSPTVDTGALQERLTPNAVLASTNLQDSDLTAPPALLTDLDEETGSGDSLWWTAIDPEADIDVRFAFPTSSGNLIGTQTLRVQIRGTSLPSRDWRVDLWESGSEKVPTATGTVTSISGEVVQLQFEPTDITDITGAGVEVRIRATAA